MKSARLLHPSLLLDPGIGQRLRKLSCIDISVSGAIDDDRDELGRYECQPGKETNMTLDLAFALGNIGEGRDPAFHEIIDPDSCLCDRGEQRVARPTVNARMAFRNNRIKKLEGVHRNHTVGRFFMAWALDAPALRSVVRDALDNLTITGS